MTFFLVLALSNMNTVMYQLSHSNILEKTNLLNSMHKAINPKL